MAKKSLSYGPSESLIRGAAAIGKSKLPTSMEGLQAITMVGSQMIEKDRARTAKARENIESTIAKVLLDGGTLSDKHFEEATKLAQQYKEEYMRGVAMNNSEGNVSKTKALNDLQKLSNSSNEEVDLRTRLANIKDGNVKGVEFSDNLDIATFEAYLNHDYEFRYEDGKKIYKIDNVDYTYEDMKKFANDIKNPALTDKNFSEINNLSKYITPNPKDNTKIFNSQAFNGIMLNSIATEKRDFLNQMKDTEIGGVSMEDFITNASGDILKALEQILPDGYTLVNMDDDPNLDDKDKALMIKDALLNPENGAFNVDNSRKTIAEVLTIEARNKADKDGLLYVKPKTTTKTDKGFKLDPFKKVTFDIMLPGGGTDGVITNPTRIKEDQFMFENLIKKLYPEGPKRLRINDENRAILAKTYNLHGLKVKYNTGGANGYFQFLDTETNEPIGEKYTSVRALFEAANVPTEYMNVTVSGVSSAAAFN